MILDARLGYGRLPLDAGGRLLGRRHEPIEGFSRLHETLLGKRAHLARDFESSARLLGHSDLLLLGSRCTGFKPQHDSPLT